MSRLLADCPPGSNMQPAQPLDGMQQAEGGTEVDLFGVALGIAVLNQLFQIVGVYVLEVTVKVHLVFNAHQIAYGIAGHDNTGIVQLVGCHLQSIHTEILHRIERQRVLAQILQFRQLVLKTVFGAPEGVHGFLQIPYLGAK